MPVSVPTPEAMRELGERIFSQEYLCNFEEAVDSVFRGVDIDALASDDVADWGAELGALATDVLWLDFVSACTAGAVALKTTSTQ